MKAVTGIFKDLDTTTKVIAELREFVDDDRINVLTPATRREEIEEIPTDTGMPPVGGPLGATLGGALGIASVIAIPGVGLVSAIGLAWSLALGTVGGVTGWIVGDLADHALTGGIPTEELFFYEEAIRAGHSVVLVMTEDRKETLRAREVLDRAGAADVDATRHTWWIGLRDAEWADWTAHHGSDSEFDEIEEHYLRGFTTSLRPDFRELDYEHAREKISPAEIDRGGEEAFRHGYERGRRYLMRTRRVTDAESASRRS